jgi:hypothetical protein
MTAIAKSLTPNVPTESLLRRAWSFSPLLALAGAASLALIPIFVIAALADPRLINGAPAWIKPLKFAISIAIYSATFIWLLSFVQGRKRLVRIAAGITGLGLLVEMALIAMQVVRGVGSHFNVSTPFDTAVFSIMGSFISIVALCTLLLAFWLVRQRLPDPAFAWGLRLGVLVSFAGMAVGFLMTAPTPAQLAAAQAGGGMPLAGAHSVGVTDGGVGLPLLGWSTAGGDLRAAHFFGLHAMQVLPLVGGLLALEWTRRRLTRRQRVGLVWTAGLGYLGLVLLLTWQALRGQSIIAPDAVTLGALAALTGAVLLAAGLILITPRLLSTRRKSM